MVGTVCAIVIGCTSPFPDFEIYPTEAACLHLIDFFKHNTKYVISYDPKCEPSSVEGTSKANKPEVIPTAAAVRGLSRG